MCRHVVHNGLSHVADCKMDNPAFESFRVGRRINNPAFEFGNSGCRIDNPAFRVGLAGCRIDNPHGAPRDAMGPPWGHPGDTILGFYPRK